MIVVVIN